MSAVKRYLEDLTDPILNSVRITGAAVLVDREPIEQFTTWISAPEQTLRKALDLAAEWLSGPTAEQRAELDRLERELREWKSAAPPDALIDYLDMLQDLVSEFVMTLNEWMEPYELRAGWSDGALIIKRERDWS